MYMDRHPTSCCGARIYNNSSDNYYSSCISMPTIIKRKCNIHDLHIKGNFDLGDVPNYLIFKDETREHRVVFGQNRTTTYVDKFKNNFNPDIMNFKPEKCWVSIIENHCKISLGPSQYNVKYYDDFPYSRNRTQWAKCFDYIDEKLKYHKGIVFQGFILNYEQMSYDIAYSMAHLRGFTLLPESVKNSNTGHQLFYFYRLSGV